MSIFSTKPGTKLAILMIFCVWIISNNVNIRHSTTGKVNFEDTGRGTVHQLNPGAFINGSDTQRRFNRSSYIKGTMNYTTLLKLCSMKFDSNIELLSDHLKYRREKQKHCSDKNTTGKSQRLPHAIIIGVEKAGTAALKFFLNDHPDIVFPLINEVQFFNSKLYEKLGLDWYRQQMGYSRPYQLTIEKSPMYYRMSKPSARRIFQMNNTIKILVVVKDPVNRTVSHYAHKLDKYGDRQPLEALLLTENGDINANLHELSESRYYDKIKLWFDVFRRDQILIVDGDRLASDIVAEMSRVERFLGVKRHTTLENVVFVQNKGQSGGFCLKMELPDSQACCLPESKGRAHPEVSLEVIRKMKEYFAPYNEQFFKLVGKDFGWNTKRK